MIDDVFLQGGDQRAGPHGQRAAALRHADVVAGRRQDAPRARRQHRHEGCTDGPKSVS